MMFTSRITAARTLSEQLKKLHLKKPLVLAIPRGAVPMGCVVARELNAELDVILVHKFCPAWQPEFAIGAVTEDGAVLLNAGAHQLGLSEAEIRTSAEEQIKKLNARRALYTPFRNSISPTGRQVIVVDDGIATGATVKAAVQLLRAKKAARIVVAAPVAAPEAALALKAEGVETCFLATPQDFFAVGQFYRSFPQVEDKEVTKALRDFAREHEALSSRTATAGYERPMTGNDPDYLHGWRLRISAIKRSGLSLERRQ